MVIRTFNELRDAQHAISRKRDGMIKQQLAKNSNKAGRSYAMHTQEKSESRKVGNRADRV